MEGGDRVYWVNPSDPRNVTQQAEMMAEVAANYAVDGVHFDYIRYENYNGSYGEADRQRFEEWRREPVANWPDDVLIGTRDRPAGPLHGFFCRWRTDQVSEVVRACAEAVRKASTDCKLSAAVYPSFPYHRKSVAQDWARWLRNGWLDFVCPMTYDSPGYYDRHLDRVGRQRPAAEGQLMVGIGAWLHGDAITIADQYYESALKDVDFIKKFIFPGGFLPSVSTLCNSIATVTDMKLFHLQDIGPHYAKTLNAWRQRFFDNVNEIAKLGYPDEFVRLWDYYFCYCEGGFIERDIGTVQMLLTKQQCRIDSVRV